MIALICLCVLAFLSGREMYHQVPYTPSNRRKVVAMEVLSNILGVLAYTLTCMLLAAWVLPHLGVSIVVSAWALAGALGVLRLYHYLTCHVLVVVFANKGKPLSASLCFVVVLMAYVLVPATALRIIAVQMPELASATPLGAVLASALVFVVQLLSHLFMGGQATSMVVHFHWLRTHLMRRRTRARLAISELRAKMAAASLVGEGVPEAAVQQARQHLMYAIGLSRVGRWREAEESANTGLLALPNRVGPQA